jgi:hypothetical protein
LIQRLWTNGSQAGFSRANPESRANRISDVQVAVGFSIVGPELIAQA